MDGVQGNSQLLNVLALDNSYQTCIELPLRTEYFNFGLAEVAIRVNQNHIDVFGYCLGKQFVTEVCFSSCRLS